jgi:ribosomal protein S6--L-glutamate ligase
MNIIILSRLKSSYSTKRLVEEAKIQGHHVEVIDPLRCYINISSNKPMVFYKRKKLDYADIIIPRIGASISTYGMAIVRQFEMMGVYCLNTSNAIGRSRDKLRSLQILSQLGIPLPKTSFANSTQQTDQLIKLVGGAPTVVKLSESSQGRGVVLAQTASASKSLIDAFRELRANFLVQEFLQESNGTDIRCLVLGDEVIATMMRTAKSGEFRSNLHRGGNASTVLITPEEREIAIASTKAMKLNLSGVDLIRSKSGSKVLEVNSSPGLEGIEKCNEKNIARSIIQYMELKYRDIILDN